MIGYLGVPGSIVSLSYRGGLETVSDRPVSFTRTLGGKRKAFVGSSSRREWDLSVDLVGSKDTSGLVSLSQGANEVLWYPADAVSGNMLSPQAVGFNPVPMNAADSGFVLLPDGSVAKSVSNSGAGGVTIGNSHGGYEMVPIQPGMPVTVGAWGLGGIRFTGSWRDATQGSVGSILGTPFSFSGWGFRSQTFMPPVGAAFLNITMTDGVQYARPSIAWGNVAQDKPGRGCPAAVVHGLSEALTVISADDSYGSIGLSITEVG